MNPDFDFYLKQFVAYGYNQGQNQLIHVDHGNDQGVTVCQKACHLRHRQCSKVQYIIFDLFQTAKKAKNTFWLIFRPSSVNYWDVLVTASQMLM